MFCHRMVIPAGRAVLGECISATEASSCICSPGRKIQRVLVGFAADWHGCRKDQLG